MEAKELEDKAKQLAKAATGGDPPATILQMLDSLKTWTATEKLLRSTKIGVHVNKLRQNPDAAVARQASTLVNKWKTDVKKGPATSATSSPAPKSANSGTASPAPVAKAKTHHQGDPEKRNTVTDKVEWKLTGSATRDACVKLMYDGLAFMSTERMSRLTPPVSPLHHKLTGDSSLRGHSHRRSLCRTSRIQRVPARGQSRVQVSSSLPFPEPQEQRQP